MASGQIVWTKAICGRLRMRRSNEHIKNIEVSEGGQQFPSVLQETSDTDIFSRTVVYVMTVR